MVGMPYALLLTPGAITATRKGTGLPCVLQRKRRLGPQYSSGEFKTSPQNMDSATAPAAHTTHRGTERQRVCRCCQKGTAKGSEMKEDPMMALLCIRTTPLSSGIPSPDELLFNRRVNSNLPAINNNSGREETNV